MFQLSLFIISTLIFKSESSIAPTCVSYDITYFPDEEDCTKYWECLNGDAMQLQCPNGQYFNPDILGCDQPQNVDCKSSPNDLPTPEPPDCPDNEDITFIPADDCTRYWECLYGDGTLMQCPNGQYFNPEILACDSPDAVECSNDK